MARRRVKKRRTKKRKLTAAQRRARRRAYYHKRIKPLRRKLRRRNRIPIQERIDRAKTRAFSMMGFPPLIPASELRAVGAEGQIYHRGKWRPTRWSQGHGSLMLVDGVWTPT